MGGGGGGRGKRSRGSSSSSGEEDGDGELNAAIDSIVSATHKSLYPNGSAGAAAAKATTRRPDGSNPGAEEDGEKKQMGFSHYRIKVQKHLHDMLEKSLVMVRNPIAVSDNDTTENEGKIRLFKHSSPGIVFDHMDDYERPRKKPRILPWKPINEKSKKFKQRVESVAVDGKDILAAAKVACQKSLARQEARDAAAKAAAKREELRVAELKKIRGERWLPSIAKEMSMKFYCK